MAQQIKVLVAQPEDLGSIPKVEANKWSPGTRTHTHACVQTCAINQLFINQNEKRKGIGL